MTGLTGRLVTASILIVLTTVAATWTIVSSRTEDAVVAAFEAQELIGFSVQDTLSFALGSGASPAEIAELVRGFSQQADVRMAAIGFDDEIIVDTGPDHGVAVGADLPRDPLLVTPLMEGELGIGGGAFVDSAVTELTAIAGVELTDRELREQEQITELTAACLSEAEAPFTVRTSPSGIGVIDVLDRDDLELHGECARLAYVEVLGIDPFEAPSAPDPGSSSIIDLRDGFESSESLEELAGLMPPEQVGLLLYVGIGRSPFEPTIGIDGGMVTAIIAVLLLAIAAAAWSARLVLRPVGQLRSASAAMASGDLGARVAVTGDDELAALSSTFNGMAERLEEDVTRRKALTDDVAHELRSPLTNLRGLVSAARDGLMPVDADLLTAIDEESSQLAGIVGDLEVLARSDDDRLMLDREEVDLAELAAVVVAAHEGRATDAGVALSVTGDAGVAAVDVRRMRQVLGNLVANAIRHTPAEGTVTVQVQRTADAVTLAVTDTGEGIAAAHLDMVFERFWRADEARSRDRGGSGLGLAVVRGIVAAHGGAVSVTSEVGVGSTFTVVLPDR